jgi:hypothetical protein
MTQHVHSDDFLAQRWTSAHGDFEIFGKTVLQSVATESLSSLSGEERLGWLTGALGDPNAQGSDHARGQRRYPQLSFLSQAADMSASTKMDIGAMKADEFGRPETCLSRKSKLRWSRKFGQGDKLFPLGFGTRTNGESDTETLLGRL